MNRLIPPNWRYFLNRIRGQYPQVRWEYVDDPHVRKELHGWGWTICVGKGPPQTIEEGLKALKEAYADVDVFGDKEKV